MIVPVRNEAAFIGRIIGSLLAQDYPRDRFEVIVADGESTDGTAKALADIAAADPVLTVIDNPGRIVSSGLNAAIAIARGDVIIRVDGHAVVAPDFVRQNVALLAEHPEAWSVGGPIRHVGTSPFGAAVAVAMSHPLGVGDARHRFPHYEGYVEGTLFPAFRRGVFDLVGLFDVRLVRNQDDEFNYRIARAGGKVYVSPRVRSSYFVRERVGQLFRQYFQYGYWRIPVIRKHGRPTTVRQIVPTAFYAVCAILAGAGLWVGQPGLAVALPGTYLAALLVSSIGSVRTHGPRVAMRVPAAIATIHAGYALGVAYGCVAALIRTDPWGGAGRMTSLTR
jgi:glycosyltransferase involved in cell wall biosynthesis